MLINIRQCFIKKIIQNTTVKCNTSEVELHYLNCWNQTAEKINVSLTCPCVIVKQYKVVCKHLGILSKNLCSSESSSGQKLIHLNVQSLNTNFQIKKKVTMAVGNHLNHNSFVTSLAEIKALKCFLQWNHLAILWIFPLTLPCRNSSNIKLFLGLLACTCINNNQAWGLWRLLQTLSLFTCKYFMVDLEIFIYFWLLLKTLRSRQLTEHTE